MSPWGAVASPFTTVFVDMGGTLFAENEQKDMCLLLCQGGLRFSMAHLSMLVKERTPVVSGFEDHLEIKYPAVVLYLSSRNY